MTVYATILPQVFAYVLDVPDETADEIVQLLMERTPEFQHGSSFAVTADLYRSDARRIWLSEASHQRLADSSHWGLAKKV